jgi:hypothetical protein
MNIRVFLGPSLGSAEARAALPGADYHPPAQAGDVFKAVQQGATVIAIIDGFFEQVPSVWHKEVLYALHRGVRVVGASSMGALRAAELAPFGMVGVGRIFESYRDGRCEDDDEVTVSHASEGEGWRPLSEAMVNVRHALAEARARGLVGPRTHDVLIAEIKRHHYAERSWALVPEIAAAHELPAAEVQALLTFVRRERPNLKRLDALEALATLADLAAQPPFVAEFDFEPTVFWEALASTARAAPSAAGGPVPIEAIRAHVGVVEDDARGLYEGALLLYLVVKEAQRLGLRPSAEDTRRVAERFRREHGLLSAAATREWLERHRCSGDEFSALMELQALVEAMLVRQVNGVDAFLPAELQRRGRFAAVAEAVDDKRRQLGSLGLAFPSPEDAGTTAAELLAFYQDRFRRLDAPFDEHRRARGVSDRNRFLRELLAEYLVLRQAEAAHA